MNVPDRLISSNSDIQKKVEEVGDAYKKYCESLVNRYHIYGSSLSGKLEQKKEDNLSKILSGIPGANIPHIEQEPQKRLVWQTIWIELFLLKLLLEDVILLIKKAPNPKWMLTN